MENKLKTKFLNVEKRKMTLKCYYNSLPKSESPRSNLIKEISLNCDVSQTTARNWVLYGVKPKVKEHISFLSMITGIKEDCLW